MKILILNGPNLNMLGAREPEIYGKETLSDVNEKIKKAAQKKEIDVDFFQSNCEGELIDKIQDSINKFDGIIINAGAYTHTSLVIKDAISSVNIPVVEVHLSNIYKREEYRHNSYIAPVSLGQISGFGPFGYILALEALLNNLNQ